MRSCVLVAHDEPQPLRGPAPLHCAGEKQRLVHKCVLADLQFVVVIVWVNKLWSMEFEKVNVANESGSMGIELIVAKPSSHPIPSVQTKETLFPKTAVIMLYDQRKRAGRCNAFVVWYHCSGVWYLIAAGGMQSCRKLRSAG